MEPPPVILDGSQRPPFAFDAVRAQDFAAAVWQLMQDGRPPKNAPRPADNARQLNLANGAEPLGPEPQKLVFNEPFDQDKANALITQLGAARYLDREAAQDKLTRMGEPVLPMLAAAQGNTKDVEVQVRAQNTIEIIKSGVHRNNLIDVLGTFHENSEAWKELLRCAGKRLVDNRTIPPVIDNNGAIQVVGPHIVLNQTQSAPTKEEQQKFDKMIKDFDAIPDLKTLIDESKRKAQSLDATPRERAEYEELMQLEWAKREVRMDYALALSASKDPADLKKGESLLIEELKKMDHKLNHVENTDMLRRAVALGADRSPEFLKALRESGGNTDDLHNLRWRWMDQQAEERVQAKDRERKEARQKNLIPLEGEAARQANDKALKEWQKTWAETQPTFKELLKRVGSLPAPNGRDEVPPPENSDDMFLLSPANKRTPPSKEEQEKLDRFIKTLDGLPALDLNALNGDDFLNPAKLEMAQQNVRELYASALVSSDDPDDRAKAGQLLIEHLRNTEGLMLGRPGIRIGELAMRLNLDRDPVFREAFAGRAGNLERLTEQRAAWDEWNAKMKRK